MPVPFPRLLRAILICSACLLLTSLAAGVPPQHGTLVQQQPPPADATLAAARIRLPQDSGLQVELFASEPLLENPVAFAFDHQSRILVAEAFRIHEGVTDNRDHMYWLDDDIACRTVADRDAKYRKHLKEKYETYTRQRDRVRLLWSSKGSGKPDSATVFAESDHRAIDGLGSGVLAHQGYVYYTCIPDLLRFREDPAKHQAIDRQVLSTGYGVHTSFFGHDLHGLVVSPVDGKIYFSIGDRGANITTREGKKIEVPHTGAVFRCNPDGSALELFAQGLRNPQELAFDDFGNLFTGDNNSDSGDRARFVYLPEGADCGWHIGWQYLEQPFPRGPWNSEFMWHPPRDDQPKYIVPPITNLGDGPSGLVFYPGTGLTDRYRGHFFLADFRGTPTSSGIRSFAVKPKGAGFELIDSHQFAWNILATDVDFGPDGALYILDWVEGWGKTGKGRIHRIADPKYVSSAQALEIRELLAGDWSTKTPEELGNLLGHMDRRVRMEAQFTLVRHSLREAVQTVLLQSLVQKSNVLARLHAMWGMGQLLVKTDNPVFSAALKEATRDAEDAVAINALRVLARPNTSLRLNPDQYRRLFQHSNLPVKAQAAVCLGKQGAQESLPALIELIKGPNFTDPWLRHACVMGLSALMVNQSEANVEQACSGHPATRLALVLSYRRLGAMEKLLPFMNDEEAAVQFEAIRAVHDLPVVANPQLLTRLPAIRREMPLPIQLRLLHFHYMLGNSAAASVLANYASDHQNPARLRGEAVKMLGAWANPAGRDWVTGLWRPIPTRSPEPAQRAVRESFEALLKGPNQLVLEALRAAGKLQLRDLGPRLLEFCQEKQRSLDARVEAIQNAAQWQTSGLQQVAKALARDPAGKLRTTALGILAKVNPVEAIASLGEILEQGEAHERQAALRQLTDIAHPQKDTLIESWLKKFAAGQVPVELQLDLMEAASKAHKSEWDSQLDQGRKRLEQTGPYGEFRMALAGGNRESGRRIFFEKTEAACLRCHKIGRDGGEVGPELTHIAKEKNREYLLESLVDPNKTIAKGFELSIILTTDGVVHQGVVKGEDEKEVKLITPEAKVETIAKKDIEERKTGKSAMPEDTIKHLTLRELRDLLEYLGNLR